MFVDPVIGRSLEGVPDRMAVVQDLAQDASREVAGEAALLRLRRPALEQQAFLTMSLMLDKMPKKRTSSAWQVSEDE